MDKRVPADKVSAPICLPGGKLFPDHFKNGTVIGMGYKWNPKHDCSTVSGGPSPFSPCKFPFSTKTNGRSTKNYRCERNRQTPASNHKMCRDFHKRMVKKLKLKARYSVQINYNKTQVKCYDLEPHGGNIFKEIYFLPSLSF